MHENGGELIFIFLMKFKIFRLSTFYFMGTNPCETCKVGTSIL